MYLLDLERRHHPCVLPFPRVMPVESPVSSAVVICVEIRAVVLCVEEHARAGRRVRPVVRAAGPFGSNGSSLPGICYLLDLERKHHPCVLPFSRVILVESPVSSAVVIICVEMRAWKDGETASRGCKSNWAFFIIQ